MPSRRVSLAKKSLHSTDDSFDREFYARMTAAEKVARTYQLSVEMWELNSGKPVEQRLLRHITRVIRNGR